MTSNIRRQRSPARSWLLYNTWFALLVVCVSAAVTLQLPISRASWPIFFCCSGLGVLLSIRSRRAPTNRGFAWRSVLPSVVILGTVVVVLHGSLVKGEFVSVFPDSWAYSAFATYVQNPVPPTGAGLQPILSFGRGLMVARFGTAGLLALLAEIFGTDPCRAANVYACLVLIHIGVGFALLARIFKAGWILSICAGIFGVSIGWAPEILKIGNWDQVLFLSFIPFVVLRMRLLTFQTSRMSGILALGLSLGAAAYAYPEGAAICGLIYGPLLVWQLIRGRDIRGKLRRLTVAAGVALFVSGIYLPRFIVFLRGQIYSGTTNFNAKGVVAGLLSARWLPAVYGLGEQPPTAGLDMKELFVPLLFVGLSFTAFRSWWRKKDGILLTVPVFCLLALWQAGLVKYDYGFYKVLTMFWPVMVTAIFVGMSRLLAWSPTVFPRTVLVAGFCGLMAGAIFGQLAHFRNAPWRQEREVNPFFELRSLKRISGDAPICIVSRSEFNQMWAVFFLQGYNIIVPHPLGYLHNAGTGLHDVSNELADGTFFLTDEKKAGAVWQNELFSLQNHLDPVQLLVVDAPNSVEVVQGDSFIWLNNQFANFTIHSDANRQALLMIDECWPGPSRPEDKHRTLIVEVNGAREELPALPNLKVLLKLDQGNNLVRLSCKEGPTVSKLSSGDIRIILLGIKGFRFAAHDEPVELSAIDAPNGVERVQGDSFIWLNNQFTDFKVDAETACEAFLEIRDCWPGPSRPEDPKRTLIFEVNGKKAEMPASSNLKVPLTLNQGNNLVRLSCKETPTVEKLSSGDTRKLLLGIKGFSLVGRNDPVELLGINAPNRVETVQGDSFVWLNNQFTDLTIRSDEERQALLTVHECWAGPSRPEDTNRTLIVEVNGIKMEVSASPNLKVPLKLNRGTNLVRLSCKETPTVEKLSSGDIRTLLLGIKGFGVTAGN